MKKLLLILLLPILAQADIQRVDDESRLPYWRSSILSGDPNQMDEYFRIFIKELERIQSDLITAVNLGIDIDDTNIRYFGGKNEAGDYPDGTWRLIKITVDDFELQKLIAGTWTQMSKWSEVGGFEFLDIMSDSGSSFQVSSGAITGATTLNLSSLTASRLIFGDSGKNVDSVEDLTVWIGGTTNQVLITDNGDGTITISLPQDIHTGATPTFAGLTLNGTLNMNGSVDMNDNPIVDLNYIDFDLVNGVAASEGRLVWNDDEGTLNLGMKGGVVNQQIGLEDLLRGKNTEGVQIDNMRAIRISGASGSNPEFGLTDSDDPTAMGAIGLATEDIVNNQFGYGTTRGRVREGDTSGTPFGEVWAAGNLIWAATTSGELTNVVPIADERKIFIGIVLRAHATEGVIWVGIVNTSFPQELSGVDPAALADNVILQYDSGTSTWPLTSDPDFTGLDVDGTTRLGDGGSTDYTEISSTGNVSLFNGHEIRFYDIGSSNYVGFKSNVLTGNQIWILPTADGKPGSVLNTDGFGNTSWSPNASEKSWPFRSRSGASGTNYAGGFYLHSGTANDFSPATTHGTANASYAAHFFVVTGASTVDELTLTITGTTIDDTGNYDNSPDTATIVIPNSTAADTYYETDEKWLGQVSIAVTSGTATICDFGYTKYWDNNNTDFRVAGVEVTWLGGATDTAPNLILRHHIGTAGNTNWTYTGTGATPPTPIAAMVTDHTTTEDNVINGENGAWKRTNLSTNVTGSASCGTIIEIVTSANRTFELGNFMVRIAPGVSENVIFNGENVIFAGEQVVYP